MAFKEVIALSFMCFLEHNAAHLFHGESNPGQVTTLGPLGTDATLSVLVKEVFDLKEVRKQCPYLLKFVDIVLDVEVTTDLIIKLRIRRMVFTKPLVDIHVKYQLLSLR